MKRTLPPKKVYEVLVPVIHSEVWIVEAQSEEEAIENYQFGECHGESVFGDENQGFRAKEIKREV